MLRQIKFQTNSELIKSTVLEFVDEWNSNSLSITTKTSGSTGSPKTIELSKNHMAISAHKTLDFLNLTPNSTALLCLSPETIAGKMMIVRSIVGSLKLVVADINSNPLVNIDEDIDFIALVPMQLETILTNNPDRLRKCSKIIIGGGPISKNLEKQLKEENISAYHTFGMTETISHVALRQIGLGEEAFFTALPGVFFTEERSQLIIHYPEIGIERIKTNDTIQLIDSKHFKWIGRTDFIINSGGIKINPENVENSISHLIDSPFFIYGLANERLGQKVVLIIENAKATVSLSAELENILPKYSVPKEIYTLAKFIRTESGKINRIETAKLLES